MNGLPPEYCEYYPDYDKTRPWIAEHCPHLLKGEDEAGDVGKKGKRGGGVIKKKTISADKQKVIISKEVRNKKKAVTSVEGLETFSVKLKDAAKVFGKKFAASSSVKEKDSGGQEIVIQGDVIWDLPALLEVFPDARLIFTHRDPKQVVGSAASLAWNQTIIYSDHNDPAQTGRQWLGKTATMIERMRAARDAIPRDRMIDVQYDDMETDWRGTMERVYRFLELDMAPAVDGMQRFLDRSARLKRRPHRYSLAEFGLRADEVDERFANYTATYGIPVEGPPAPLRRRVAGAAHVPHTTIRHARHFLQEDQGPAIAEFMLAQMVAPN